MRIPLKPKRDKTIGIAAATRLMVWSWLATEAFLLASQTVWSKVVPNPITITITNLPGTAPSTIPARELPGLTNQWGAIACWTNGQPDLAPEREVIVQTDTNGDWFITTYRPDGTFFGQVSASVQDLGKHIIYKDGGKENTDYPDPYYWVSVAVVPAGADPPPRALASPATEPGLIKVVLSPRRTGRLFIPGSAP